MLQIYSHLVKTPVKEHPQYLAEKRSPYLSISERHVQALWWEQLHFTPLKTSHNQKIVVLSPGQWNSAAGPDFFNAHLLIDNQEFRGDIEIHLSDEGWKSHGHDEDPLYNNTVLHISLWEPINEKPLKTAAGREIPRLYLENQLTINIEKIASEIDIDLYPYKPHLGTGKCANAVFSSLTDSENEAFFSGAAFWRLEKKAEQIRALSLKAALARSLGFPHNSGAFLMLFQNLSKLPETTHHEQYQALGMGMCGYFDETHQKKWGQSPYYNMLLSLWEHNRGDYPHIQLYPQKTRPLHHPVRRIAALSFLLADKNLDTLHERLQNCLQRQKEVCHTKKHWRYLWDSLLQQLPDYTSSHWNKHYFFELEEQEEHLTLLGSQIKQEMMLNVILPLLYQESRGETETIFWKLYKEIQSSSSSKSNYLRNRFYGDNQNGNLLKYAYASQGAFQLHSDFCRHFETSCIGCPFIERFEKSKLN